MYFEKDPTSTKVMESCNNWLNLNRVLNDILGTIMSKNFMGKIYFNLYKLNNSNKNNLDKSKNFYVENIKYIKNKIDDGSKIQIFTSFADLMEIAKYEKDEKSYSSYSEELFSLIKNFGKIENKFFKNIFEKAFISTFKKSFIPKNKIKEILG